MERTEPPVRVTGRFKFRPAIIIISGGLVVALCAVAFKLPEMIIGGISGELLAAVIAFGGAITTAISAVATKLVESEESSSNNA